MKLSKNKIISILAIVVILIAGFLFWYNYIKQSNEGKMARYSIVGLTTDSKDFGTPESRAVIAEINNRFTPLYIKFKECDGRLLNTPILSPQSLENIKTVKQMVSDTNCMVTEIQNVWNSANELYDTIPKEFASKYPEYDAVINEYINVLFEKDRSEFMETHTNKQIDYYFVASSYYNFVLINYEFFKFIPNDETKTVRVEFIGSDELKTEYEQLLNETVSAEKTYFNSYDKYKEYIKKFYSDAGIILPDSIFDDKEDVHT